LPFPPALGLFPPALPLPGFEGSPGAPGESVGVPPEESPDGGVVVPSPFGGGVVGCDPGSLGGGSEGTAGGGAGLGGTGSGREGVDAGGAGGDGGDGVRGVSGADASSVGALGAGGAGAGAGAGSVTTTGPFDSVESSTGRADARPSVRGLRAGRSSAARRACRPAASARPVRSWIPSSALSSEIARLRSPPPPSPGTSGSPGSAMPTQRMPANVAVEASPADSSADSVFEAARHRLFCRLFSIVRIPLSEGVTRTSAGFASARFPRPSERPTNGQT
jgi:hypothetical protein